MEKMEKLEKLEAENARLTEENAHLNERIENLRSNLANAVHRVTVLENRGSKEVQIIKNALCECEQRLESAKTELKHVKKVLFQKNRRYQEDCITINRLQVTIETLVERMAQKMGR
jgi:regulator of replication initiation timing